MIRLVVVDDHPALRRSLVGLLSMTDGLEVVGEAANGLDAIAQVQQLRPDVVLMDVTMPVLGGVEATRRLAAELPEVRVIGLSMHDPEHVGAAMRAAGAAAYVCKDAPPATLLGAIRGVGPAPAP